MVNLLALNLITQLISPDALDKLIDSRTVTLSQTKSYREVKWDRSRESTLTVCGGAPAKRGETGAVTQSSVYLSTVCLRLSTYLPI